MSTASLRTPKYRQYRPKNLAVVRLNGKDFYLGSYGSAESHRRYDALIAEWLRNGRKLTEPTSPSVEQTVAGITVADVMVAYWDHAVGYYVKNGKPTDEIHNIRAALRHLRRLYEMSSAPDFGPQQLEVVRDAMIEAGLSRNGINARVGRIKRMFRWASKRGMVPATTYHGLLAIDGLQRGRSKARETVAVRPVSDAHIEAVLPYLQKFVRAMVQIQNWTGMRPQDIRNLRTCDVDTTGDVWVYVPWTHKTEHHGHTRRVAIGPKAQAVLRPFLRRSSPKAFVFSPKEALRDWRGEVRRQRKTPVTPSHKARGERHAREKLVGDQYSKTGYDSAIRRACVKAKIAHWSPNQLRHACGTRVRKQFGLEGSAVVLGNGFGTVTEVYAEANFDKAIAIMRAIG